MTKTPIIFATFARPEYARKAFNQIKKAKPRKLYFYSNKARENDYQEIERNQKIRALINEVDWECELKIYFRDKYVDLYTSLWGAYDWVFQNEESAIVIEEDCVASLAFFDYCDKLIPKYEKDNRIWIISGNNFFEYFNPNNYDYIFTRYPYQWGWATWRDRWQRIKRTNIPWEEMKRYKLFMQLYPNKKQANYHLKTEEAFYKNLKNVPAWDLTMGFTYNCEGGFGIIPTKNLVMNIGCNGTHHSGYSSFIHSRAVSNKDSYLIKNPPPFVVPDYRYDQYFFKHFYYNKNRKHIKIIKKIKDFIYKIKDRKQL